MISFSSTMSVTERTKESPIQSKSLSSAKSKSRKSFFVKQGREIFVFGRFTPFLEESVPPEMMVALTSSRLLVDVTCK